MLKKIWDAIKINTAYRAYVFLFLFAALSSIYSLVFKRPVHHNNYIIFKSGFFHLLNEMSLYQAYPQEHGDYFKYSPVFALFFGLFAYLPNIIGATLWNLLGTGMLVYGLRKLPLTDKQRLAAFWVFVPAYIGSVMNFQSNVHIVALLLIFWQALEDRRPFLAAATLAVSIYIKIFSGLGLLMMIFFIKDFKFTLKFSAALALSMGLLFLAPLSVIPWDNLLFQYREWMILLKMDSDVSYGYSVMNIIHLATGKDFKNSVVQLPAVMIWSVIFAFCYNVNYRGRLMAFASLCCFFVLFNHRSESATFVIPMLGFGLYQNFIENQKWRWTLIAGALIGVNFFHSSLFTTELKYFLNAYAFKIWPFLVIGPVILFHLLRERKKTSNN